MSMFNAFLNKFGVKISEEKVAATTVAIAPKVKADLVKGATLKAKEIEQLRSTALAKLQALPEIGTWKKTILIPLTGANPYKRASWLFSFFEEEELDSLVEGKVINAKDQVAIKKNTTGTTMVPKGYFCTPETLTEEGRELAKDFADEPRLQVFKDGAGNPIRLALRTDRNLHEELFRSLALELLTLDGYGYLVLEVECSLDPAAPTEGEGKDRRRVGEPTPFWAYDGNTDQPVYDLQGEVPGLYARIRIDKVSNALTKRVKVEKELDSFDAVAALMGGVTVGKASAPVAKPAAKPEPIVAPGADAGMGELEALFQRMNTGK